MVRLVFVSLFLVIFLSNFGSKRRRINMGFAEIIDDMKKAEGPGAVFPGKPGDENAVLPDVHWTVPVPSGLALCGGEKQVPPSG